MSLRVGDVVRMDARKFKVIGKLGKGAFGRVLLVRDETKGGEFALKDIDVARFGPDYLETAMAEIDVMQLVSHSNLLEYDCHATTEDGRLRIVLQFCDGGDLEKLFKRSTGVFDEDQVMRVFVQLCLGLEYLHDRNIVHRDLKPENIFSMVDTRLILGDFGVSKQLHDRAALTKTIVGTPLFMAPELLQHHSYGKPVDVWAAACILYMLIHPRKEQPFIRARDADHLLELILKPPPTTTRPDKDISPQLKGLMAQMFAHAAEERPTFSQILSLPWVQAHALSYFREIGSRDTSPARCAALTAQLTRLGILEERVASGPDVRKWYHSEDAQQLLFMIKMVVNHGNTRVAQKAVGDTAIHTTWDHEEEDGTVTHWSIVVTESDAAREPPTATVQPAVVLDAEDLAGTRGPRVMSAPWRRDIEIDGSFDADHLLDIMRTGWMDTKASNALLDRVEAAVTGAGFEPRRSTGEGEYIIEFRDKREHPWKLFITQDCLQGPRHVLRLVCDVLGRDAHAVMRDSDSGDADFAASLAKFVAEQNEEHVRRMMTSFRDPHADARTRDEGRVMAQEAARTLAQEVFVQLGSKYDDVSVHPGGPDGIVVRVSFRSGGAPWECWLPLTGLADKRVEIVQPSAPHVRYGVTVDLGFIVQVERILCGDPTPSPSVAGSVSEASTTSAAESSAGGAGGAGGRSPSATKRAPKDVEDEYLARIEAAMTGPRLYDPSVVKVVPPRVYFRHGLNIYALAVTSEVTVTNRLLLQYMQRLDDGRMKTNPVAYVVFDDRFVQTLQYVVSEVVASMQRM